MQERRFLRSPQLHVGRFLQGPDLYAGGSKRKVLSNLCQVQQYPTDMQRNPLACCGKSALFCRGRAMPVFGTAHLPPTPCTLSPQKAPVVPAVQQPPSEAKHNPQRATLCGACASWPSPARRLQRSLWGGSARGACP